jgi:hypothetical protein
MQLHRLAARRSTSTLFVSCPFLLVCLLAREVAALPPIPISLSAGTSFHTCTLTIQPAFSGLPNATSNLNLLKNDTLCVPDKKSLVDQLTDLISSLKSKSPPASGCSVECNKRQIDVGADYDCAGGFVRTGNTFTSCDEGLFIWITGPFKRDVSESKRGMEIMQAQD